VSVICFGVGFAGWTRVDCDDQGAEWWARGNKEGEDAAFLWGRHVRGRGEG
jgi:hypothetical protein